MVPFFFLLRFEILRFETAHPQKKDGLNSLKSNEVRHFQQDRTLMPKPARGLDLPPKSPQNGSQKARETPVLMGISAADARFPDVSPANPGNRNRSICAGRCAPRAPRTRKRHTERPTSPTGKNIFSSWIFNFSQLGKFCEAFSRFCHTHK